MSPAAPAVRRSSRGCVGSNEAIWSVGWREKGDYVRLKVMELFADVRVREVRDAEIDRFDPERLSFMNINTPDDYANGKH